MILNTGVKKNCQDLVERQIHRILVKAQLGVSKGTNPKYPNKGPHPALEFGQHLVETMAGCCHAVWVAARKDSGPEE